MTAITAPPNVSALLPALLPLLASVGYVAAALCLKRAGELGAESWRLLRLCNYAAALAMAPPWLLGGQIAPLAQWWQPALVAVLFIGGQLLTLLALRVGDVSIATPVLGLKILMVAALTALLLRQPLSAGLWAAAVLSTVAVVLLNFSRPKTPHRVGLTMLLAASAAGCYTLFDILVQQYAPAWGAGRFLPIMMTMAALFSIGLRGGAGARTARGRAGLPWAVGGAAFLAVQAVMLVSSIAIYRHAAMANILYSSRGLWSVIVVWLIGTRLGWPEAQHSRAVMVWRLAGATLMMAAIALGAQGGAR